MNLFENAPLAPLTTFHTGGNARYLIAAHTEQDIDDAIAFARERQLPLRLLGAGSNVLVPDAGIEAIVLRPLLRGISFTDEGADTLVTAGAGELWDALVDAAAARTLYGLENLAGIPGSVGGAVVQNIGAYGAELADVFVSADTIDGVSGERGKVIAEDAGFDYRASVFKKDRTRIITRATLRLKRTGQPNLAYADLSALRAKGTPLDTPLDIMRAVRAIRSDKFPDYTKEGTAGSFFKNPIIPADEAAALRAAYPDLPAYPQADESVKVSLAWLLDHALALKGYAHGMVRLYEKQPLVIVAQFGASSSEVDAFANTITERIRETLGISVEREVESFTFSK
ncbi:UDP-N-acetylmuramate dehydrogenase [Patescibacteria group bacterium]|nr:UDP-N-acetylmuramate dehydrogenase [Patescibacteria group bacterium]